MSVVRCVCFTINNYTLEDFADVEKLIRMCSFVVVGFEGSGEGQTPHIQGYCEFQKTIRFTSISKTLRRAHLERRLGNATQASDYCKKEGNWLEWGEIKEQGKRTDLDRIRLLALDNGGMRAVSAVGNLQQIRVAEIFLSYNEPPREWKPQVIWLWGPTGTGKSRSAREICGEDVYCKNTGTKWWDGYDGHDDIILDDFRDSWWPITYMLGLLDRYEFRVEIKGGYRQIRAHRIVITSAQNPAECYMGTGEAVEQLLRRIDIINAFLPNVADVAEVGGVIVGAPLLE